MDGSEYSFGETESRVVAKPVERVNADLIGRAFNVVDQSFFLYGLAELVASTVNNELISDALEIDFIIFDASWYSSNWKEDFEEDEQLGHMSVALDKIGYQSGKICYLDRIYVEPRCRGNHFATKILKSLSETCRMMGCEKLILEVSPFGVLGLNFEQLQSMYAKHGFEQYEDTKYMIKKIS